MEPCLATGAVRATEETETVGLKGGVLMDMCREGYEQGFEIYSAIAEVMAGRLIATWLQLVNVFPVGWDRFNGNGLARARLERHLEADSL